MNDHGGNTEGPQRRIKIREPSVYDVPDEAEDIIKNCKTDDPARSLINQEGWSSLLCKRSQRGTVSWTEYKSLRTVKAKEYLGLDTLGRQRENLQCT